MFFLTADYVAGACADAAMPDEVTALLLAATRRARDDASLRQMAHDRHAVLFQTEPFDPRAVRTWPLLSSPADPDADLLYVLVALSGLPQMRDFYRARGIPDAVYRDTLSDVLRWMEDYRARTSPTGAWGLNPRYLPWLRHHFLGEIFQLGRLQFEPGRANTGAWLYRHRTTGAVLALAEHGARFRADGHLDGAGGVADPDGAWEASLTVEPEAVTGSPIVPGGFALRRRVRLPLAEWRQALVPGDPVLHIHMPAGNPMDYHACGESFARALAFFPRYMPEHRFKAFTCSSWLLDTQLDGLLPPESNIARFQREMYLLPSASGGQATLERVFGRADVDLRTAPRDTTLRRALIDHVQAGGHIRSGRCVLFPEDFRWGEQVYRRQALDGRLTAEESA